MNKNTLNKSTISLETINEAHDRIRPFIHRTPVLTSQTINDRAGADLYFKCENFQKIGAFKARGGLNAVLQVAHNQEGMAITTHSSGNHAQAVAFAARQVGLPAYIVMPRTAPQGPAPHRDRRRAHTGIAVAAPRRTGASARRHTKGADVVWVRAPAPCGRPRTRVGVLGMVVLIER